MNRFNVAAIDWLQAAFGERLRPVFDFFSTLGGPGGWLLVGALVFWMVGSRAGLRVGFSTTIATIANDLLKWVFVSPRPYYINDGIKAMKASSGLGMPSGHAQGVAANWGAVVYWTRHPWRVYLAIVFILGTGTARVYYGLHSPAQVLVGWMLGLLTVVTVVWLEEPVVKWCRGRALTSQIAVVLGVTTAIIVVGYGISLGWRGDFQAAPEWKSRWQATVDRLIADGDEDASEETFALIEPTVSVRLGSSFLGYALCGLWVLNYGELNPKSAAHRSANVLLGLPLLVVVVVMAETQLRNVIGEAMSNATLALTLPPLIGIVVPSLTGRLFRDHVKEQVGA